MITLKRILVATDFSEPSEVALEYGRNLARAFGADLRVISVVDDLLSRAAAFGGYVTDIGESQGQLEESVRKDLEALLSDEDRRVLHAQAVVWTSTAPALAILEYAKTATIDLIVMGTHGRGAMAHLLMGSVAERVVRTAPCPVLTIRHPEHEFIRPDALVAVSDQAPTARPAGVPTR